MAYDSLETMALSAFEAVRPHERISVPEAAKRYVKIRQPGAHVGPWSAEKTPYLMEPQEVLTSLDFTGMVFVGPARTGKSQMFLNWLSHTAMTDPATMTLVHMSQNNAREWSKEELQQLLDNSDEVRAKLKPGRQADNTFDKEFTSGMRLEITWPTAKNLSGKTRRFLWIPDYDRNPDSVDKEGSLWGLAKTRARTFKRYGMCVAESSPGREVTDPKYQPKTPHEAPPAKGILSLYQDGDRRRWYWKCPQCRETFEPSFKLLSYPKSADLMESAEQAILSCPHDGFPMEPSFKEELNAAGRWVKDGMIWLPNDDIVVRNGMTPARSDIASFWLKGPAASFQDWKGLVLEYLRAEQGFESTGDEEALRKTINTDQGEPYTPKSRTSDRQPDDLKQKAEDWGDGRAEGRPADPMVPAGVRFLIATVDIQARSFVVQVHGFTHEGDIVVIDAFKITKSLRLDDDGDRLPIDPAAYGEDHRQIVGEVMLMHYPLADGTGRRMGVRLTAMDSGGAEGVTHNVYDLWRWLKASKGGTDEPPVGLHRHLLLVKGDGAKDAMRAVVAWPNSKRQDKHAVAKGDVPVVRLGVNQLKDQVAAMLSRRIGEAEATTGGGMIRYPAWLPNWFFRQITTEIRTDKGWENPLRHRNESWDLLVYALGVALRPKDTATRAPLVDIQWEKIDWFGGDCPTWALPWDDNDMVIEPGMVVPLGRKRQSTSFADLGKALV